MSANMMYGPAAHSYFKPRAVEQHSRGRTLLYLQSACVVTAVRVGARERNATGVSVTLLIFRYRDFITARCQAASQRSETES